MDKLLIEIANETKIMRDAQILWMTTPKNEYLRLIKTQESKVDKLLQLYQEITATSQSENTTRSIIYPKLFNIAQ